MRIGLEPAPIAIESREPCRPRIFRLAIQADIDLAPESGHPTCDPLPGYKSAWL
jgi:hypothetical protein